MDLFSGPMLVVGRVQGTTVLPIKKCRPCPGRYQAPKEKRFAKEFLEFFGGSGLLPLKDQKERDWLPSLFLYWNPSSEIWSLLFLFKQIFRSRYYLFITEELQPFKICFSTENAQKFSWLFSFFLGGERKNGVDPTNPTHWWLEWFFRVEVMCLLRFQKKNSIL